MYKRQALVCINYNCVTNRYHSCGLKLYFLCYTFICEKLFAIPVNKRGVTVIRVFYFNHCQQNYFINIIQQQESLICYNYIIYAHYIISHNAQNCYDTHSKKRTEKNAQNNKLKISPDMFQHVVKNQELRITVVTKMKKNVREK